MSDDDFMDDDEEYDLVSFVIIIMYNYYNFFTIKCTVPLMALSCLAQFSLP